MMTIFNAAKKAPLFVLSIFPLFLASCLGTPRGVDPVQDFEPDRYLGKWYEIARLDHPFERGLDNVTAEYSLRDDGGLNVVNRGFSHEDDEWKKVRGVAYFVKDRDVGYLKVSFFRPVYSSYVIFELDRENYDYAYVTGSDKSYLWLLSRTPEVSAERLEAFIDETTRLGYETGELIFVNHD